MNRWASASLLVGAIDEEGRNSGKTGRTDREAYRKRNVVERCVNRLKQWRGVATPYEKRAANYQTMVIIATLAIRLST
jgi:transposase